MLVKRGYILVDSLSPTLIHTLFNSHVIHSTRINTDKSHKATQAEDSLILIFIISY